MACNNGGLFGNDWIWIIIAVIVLVCFCGDSGNNNCCDNHCDCC